MITLYHCARARSFRVLWMLEELGLDYELRLLAFPPRVHDKDYLQINPLGTVPLLLDDDVRMTESSAICHYLASRQSPERLAVPAHDHSYADYLNVLSFGEATLMFPLAVYMRYTRLEPEDRRVPQAAEDYRRFFLGRLREVERRLQSGEDYLCAGRFTAADISVGYALLFAQRNGLEADLPTSVVEYLERIKMRDGFQRAISAERADPLA